MYVESSLKLQKEANSVKVGGFCNVLLNFYLKIFCSEFLYFSSLKVLFYHFFFIFSVPIFGGNSSFVKFH